MQNKKIPTPSRFGIMARQNRGGNPIPVRGISVIEYFAFCNAV